MTGGETMITIDRNGDQILIEWSSGKREWISEDDYRAYALGTKPIPNVLEAGETEPEPVPDIKVVKGRVAKKATSPVRPIEDDGAPRA